jgi:replication factor C subunit 1
LPIGAGNRHRPALSPIANSKSGEVDEKFKKKQKEEEAKVLAVAKSLGPQKGSECAVTYCMTWPTTHTPHSEEKNALWTVKYAPKQLKDICGNKGLVEKMQKWLHDLCAVA